MQVPELQLCHRGRAGSVGDEVSLVVESPAAGPLEEPVDWTSGSVFGSHSKQPSGGSTVYGSPRSTTLHSKQTSVASVYLDVTLDD